jgi:FkbM family methyltransferase
MRRGGLANGIKIVGCSAHREPDPPAEPLMSNPFSSFARTAIERFTRKWIYARCLQTSFGDIPIFVTPSAGLRYLFRSMTKIDPILLRNVTELIRQNDVVWDVGANVGLFTFAAAARAGHNGQVIAFEPDIWLVQMLRKSASVQPETSAAVTIVAAAVASDISLREFTIASRSRASNALSTYGRSQMGGVREIQTVVALSLNWLAENLPPPNVLKCDVEGAEIEIFFGQSKILNHIRPVIICEVGTEAARRITDILIKERYRLYDGDKLLSSAAEITSASWNTIAIPEELRQRYIVG